jgi:hypothetical protein
VAVCCASLAALLVFGTACAACTFEVDRGAIAVNANVTALVELMLSCAYTYLVAQQAIEGNYGVNVREFELDPDVYFAKSRSILSSTLCSRFVHSLSSY